MGLQCVVFSNVSGTNARTVPLSSYGLPCHSPRQAIGLPISHVVCMLVPCMYCLTNCGSVNARQTAAAEALMVTCFSAMNVAVILTSSMSGLMALQMYDPII